MKRQIFAIALLFCALLPQCHAQIQKTDTESPKTTIELERKRLDCSSWALIRPFPAPSNTIIIKMPHATAKPVSVVRNLLRRAVCHISFNNSIFDTDDTVGLSAHVRIVGHDNLCHLLLLVQFLQQLHHLNTGL